MSGGKRQPLRGDCARQGVGSESGARLQATAGRTAPLELRDVGNATSSGCCHSAAIVSDVLRLPPPTPTPTPYPPQTPCLSRAYAARICRVSLKRPSLGDSKSLVAVPVSPPPLAS